MILWRVVVKRSIRSPAYSIVLFISVSQRALKDGQSAFVSFHLAIGSSSCGAMLLSNIGKWSLPQSCTFHSSLTEEKDSRWIDPEKRKYL